MARSGKGKSIKTIVRSPQQDRSRQTVEAILESAVQILEVEGLQGFKVATLAERSGYGVGTLYRGALDCAAKTVTAEGPAALYKGCTAHLLRAGPHTVLTLLLLHRMQQMLGLAPGAAGTAQPPAPASRGPSWLRPAAP